MFDNVSSQMYEMDMPWSNAMLLIPSLAIAVVCGVLLEQHSSWLVQGPSVISTPHSKVSATAN